MPGGHLIYTAPTTAIDAVVKSVGGSKALKIMIMPTENHLHSMLPGNWMQYIQDFCLIQLAIDVCVGAGVQPGIRHRHVHENQLPWFRRSCEVVRKPGQLIEPGGKDVVVKPGVVEADKMDIALVEGIEVLRAG